MNLTDYYMIKISSFGAAAKLIGAGAKAAPSFARAGGMKGVSGLAKQTGKAAWGALTPAQRLATVGGAGVVAGEATS